jgi:hypothetical protein
MLYLYTFLDKCWEILQEQETGDVVVLILDDVLNYDLNSSDLIISKSAINSRSVEEILVFRWSLLNLISVEKRVFF